MNQSPCHFPSLPPTCFLCFFMRRGGVCVEIPVRTTGVCVFEVIESIPMRAALAPNNFSAY